MTTKIEVTLNPTPAHLWQKSATKKAREAAEAAGVAWIDADVLVHLPEAGRCMVKAPGFEQLVSLG